jgi:hypothetical protein
MEAQLQERALARLGIMTYFQLGLQISRSSMADCLNRR